MTTERFKLIVDAVYLFASTVGVLATAYLMFQNYNKRKVAESRENSVGAIAIEGVKLELKKNSDQISGIHDDLNDIRKENRETSREYLDTLKQLANRFKN